MPSSFLSQTLEAWLLLAQCCLLAIFIIQLIRGEFCYKAGQLGQDVQVLHGRCHHVDRCSLHRNQRQFHRSALCTQEDISKGNPFLMGEPYKWEFQTNEPEKQGFLGRPSQSLSKLLDISEQ